MRHAMGLDVRRGGNRVARSGERRGGGEVTDEEMHDIKTKAWATLAHAMAITPSAERQGLVDVGRAIDALCAKVRELRDGQR
jgi:hypothetical protein